MRNFYKRRYGELIAYLLHSIKAPNNRVLLVFTIEGILITLTNNLVNNNNYLFATRLGASDYDLSLITTLQQVVGMVVLIPGGILTDKMRNKRSMLTMALASLAIFYLAIGFVPLLGIYQLVSFILLIALSNGPMTVYNVSWQAYFSDVVPMEKRNSILTYRTSFTFLVSILVPLASGALLANVGSIGGKIRVHQIYFWLGGLMLLIQILILKLIKGNTGHSSSDLGLKNLRMVFLDLIHNKSFLGFASVALFFYMSWQMDWTLYFIGEVNYLGFNEAWLSIANILNAVAQFVTIGFWSRINVKYGVRFGIIFGGLGLAIFPIGMIIGTSIPLAQGRIIFLLLHTIASMTMAVISLNILQCLLQTLPEKNKTLNISIYTILTTISNAVMPLVGVMIYTKLGANLKALQTTFWIIFGARITATGLWFLRWWLLRKEN